MTDHIEERKIADLTGLRRDELLRYRKTNLVQGQWGKATCKPVWWTIQAATEFFRRHGFDVAALGLIVEPERTEELSTFTVIRSAPQIRNKICVEAVPGDHRRQWKTAAQDRSGVVVVRVRDNRKVRPGFVCEALKVNANYWKWRRWI